AGRDGIFGSSESRVARLQRVGVLRINRGVVAAGCAFLIAGGLAFGSIIERVIGNGGHRANRSSIERLKGSRVILRRVKEITSQKASERSSPGSRIARLDANQ